MKTEPAAWAALQTAVREPVAVIATAASGGMYNIRVSLRQRVPGEARNAIAAVFGSAGGCQARLRVRPRYRCVLGRAMDWALATRYQADRDTDDRERAPRGAARSVAGGPRAGAKVGFDCTIPFGKQRPSSGHSGAAGVAAAGIPHPSLPRKRGRDGEVRAALSAQPASFVELMATLGSRDGRELVRELDTLYAERLLDRREDGRYMLKDEAK